MLSVKLRQFEHEHQPNIHSAYANDPDLSG